MIFQGNLKAVDDSTTVCGVNGFSLRQISIACPLLEIRQTASLFVSPMLRQVEEARGLRLLITAVPKGRKGWRETRHQTPPTQWKLE
jgi:hypothetical protein